MASAKIIIKDSKVYSDGSSPVLIRIIHNRKVFTKQLFKVKAEAFDKEKGEIKNRTPGHKGMNLKIRNELSKANKYFIDCDIHSIPIDPAAYLEGKTYDQRLITAISNKINENISPRTKEKYDALIKKIEDFDYNSTISLDASWVRRFNDYLIKLGNAPTTRERALRVIKNICPSAFVGFKMPSKKTIKVKLEQSEVELLEQGHYDYESIQIAVDMWLFSYYHWGIRVHNLLTLKSENVKDGRLSYLTQKKPAKYHEVRISVKAQNIINKYLGKSKYDYLFPVVDMKERDDRSFLKHIESKTALLNRNIKKACKIVGIDKVISMHTARHTAAYILDKKGVPMQYIQDILGHESRSTTEQYVRSLNKHDRLNDAVDGLL